MAYTRECTAGYWFDMPFADSLCAMLVTHEWVQARTKPQQYTFDHVFAPTTTQDEVFTHVHPLADMVVQGFNATVMAYGCVNDAAVTPTVPCALLTHTDG